MDGEERIPGLETNSGLPLTQPLGWATEGITKKPKLIQEMGQKNGKCPAPTFGGYNWKIHEMGCVVYDVTCTGLQRGKSLSSNRHGVTTDESYNC